MVKDIYAKPFYRVFFTIAEMRGPRLKDVADCCRLPRSRTRQILNRLIASGLVQEDRMRFYATKDGITEIARHSRNRFQSVKGLVSPAPASGQAKAPILDKRETAVNQVHRHFKLSGFAVADGRRMGIGALNDPTPWFPDLWVSIPAEPVSHKAVLNAVLVEPSTRSDSAAKTIIRDYRSANIHDPQEHPLLVIARDEAAADLFWRAGDDLIMMVAAYVAFRKGPHSGPASVWRYRGQVADVNRLAQLTLTIPLTQST